MFGARKKITLIFLSTLILGIFPFPVLALTCTPGGTVLSDPGSQNVSGIVCFVLDYVNQIVLILVSGSLLVFVWGIAKFILSAGDEKKVAEGKTLMFWGVVALFVMVSVWGIIQLFYNDIFGGGSIGVPTLPEGTTP